MIAKTISETKNHNEIDDNDLFISEREELKRHIVIADNNSDDDDDKNYSNVNQHKNNKIEHENAVADAEISEALFRSFNMPKNFCSNMPTKYHVLSYISNTNAPLYIRRTGTELQVNDLLNSSKFFIKNKKI